MKDGRMEGVALVINIPSEKYKAGYKTSTLFRLPEPLGESFGG
jgi:hypothetical protein